MMKSVGKLVLIAGIVIAGSAMAQDRPRPERPQPAPGPVQGPAMACPHPTYETLTASGSSLVNADFPAIALANMQPIGGTAANKWTGYTFQWRPPACCAVTRAVLTVTLRAITAGTSNTTSDAGNDTLGVVSGGATLPGQGGFIRPNTPFAAGSQITKTFTLTGAQLATLNSNNRLSFLTQDDHAVLSATLRLERCCISAPPRP